MDFAERFAERDDGPLVISEAQVVTRATVVAAYKLGLGPHALAGIIGVSEDAVSRMERLDHLLAKGTEPFRLAVQLIRLFRVLGGVTAGDEAEARRWLHDPNCELGFIPAEKIGTAGGLADVLAHLDERHPSLR